MSMMWLDDMRTEHLLVLANFIVFIGRRWRHRAGSPPPPFVFIALAMAADIAGTVLRILALSGFTGSYAVQAAVLLQYQAFPLLLILGVGSFLLPKLFSRAEVNPQSLRAMNGGVQFESLAMGAVFLASYAFEAWGPAIMAGETAIRMAHGIRTAVWAWFLFARIRIHKVGYPQPAYLECARMSLYAVGVGMVLPVFLPAMLLAWEHIVFIGGMLWLTLSISARVVTAHGGSLDLLVRNRKATLICGAILVAAMAVWVAADVCPGDRWMHLALAGVLGLGVLGVWAWKYGRILFRFPGR